jgi:hypothetical protein
MGSRIGSTFSTLGEGAIPVSCCDQLVGRTGGRIGVDEVTRRRCWLSTGARIAFQSGRRDPAAESTEDRTDRHSAGIRAEQRPFTLKSRAEVERKIRHT